MRTVTLLLLASAALAAEDDGISRFEATLSPTARNFAAVGGNPPVPVAKCAVAFPAGFDARKEWPILVWNAPQTASAVDALPLIAKTATDAGWVALAADGGVPAKVETTEWCFAMLTAALDRMQRSWPNVRRCPVAVGGFSGGAKRSAYIGAILMEQRQPLAGIFFGGCNDDRVHDAMHWHKVGDAFRKVPMVFTAGAKDPLVPQAKAKGIVDFLTSDRFARVRLLESEGGHELHLPHLAEALRWFRETK
jgi:hypothetical protein